MVMQMYTAGNLQYSVMPTNSIVMPGMASLPPSEVTLK